MSAFLFAFVAVLVTSFGGRDQLLIAGFTHRLGRHFGVLVMSYAISIATAFAMAWAGMYIAQLLPDNAKMMLVAIAMFLAAIELVWPITVRTAKEPTRSLGAIGLILIFRQWGDASRFLVFAIAAALATPLWAGAGGAFGGIAALTLAWLLAEPLRFPLLSKPYRQALGVIIGLVSIAIGLSARGLL